MMVLRKIRGSVGSLSVALKPCRSWTGSPKGKLEEHMTHHVYKVVELVGSSPEGITQAVDAAIEKAAASLRNLRWFEVIETRGQIENGKVRCYQVTLKVGFTLEDP
jgi:flavin-binding protein dodecin